MGCGGSTSTNNTYLVQDATTAAKTCSYNICPSNTDICKIRIDFETAVLSPASSTAGTVGLCTDDSLTVSSPGGTNPPLLCGTLTGQHIYLDASTSCHKMDAVISSTDTSTSRQWRMKVSQIECGSSLLPPSGCLQYFTGTSGYLYNFGRVSSTVDGASTSKHLANQDYTMCIRREEGYCSMEYFSKYDTTDQGFAVSAGTQGLFGSVACTADYVQIPNLIAQNPTTPVSSTTALVTTLGDRICGSAWAVHPAGNAAQTYVSKYQLTGLRSTIFTSVLFKPSPRPTLSGYTLMGTSRLTTRILPDLLFSSHRRSVLKNCFLLFVIRFMNFILKINLSSCLFYFPYFLSSHLLGL